MLGKKENSGNRHKMFDQINVTARTFRDPDNPNLTGLILDVPDMDQFQLFMESEEARWLWKKMV